MSARKVVLFISMSLDGFIATQDDGLDWLSTVQKEGEDYGYAQMQARSDTYLVGRKTYDVVRQLTGGDFPQAQIFDCYIITRQDLPSNESVTFYNGDLSDLIQMLKSKGGKDIYCDGGGQVVQLLMQQDLIDEYIISVIPIMLGSGKRLFLGELDQKINLKANPPKYYDTGLVQLHYVRP